MQSSELLAYTFDYKHKKKLKYNAVLTLDISMSITVLFKWIYRHDKSYPNYRTIAIMRRSKIYQMRLHNDAVYCSRSPLNAAALVHQRLQCGFRPLVPGLLQTIAWQEAANQRLRRHWWHHFGQYINSSWTGFAYLLHQFQAPQYCLFTPKIDIHRKDKALHHIKQCVSVNCRVSILQPPTRQCACNVTGVLQNCSKRPYLLSIHQ